MTAGHPKLAQAIVKRWRRRIGLDPQWDITVRFAPNLPCSARVQYLCVRWQAVIEVSLDTPKEDLEHTLLHELLEIALGPMAELYQSLVVIACADDGARRFAVLSMNALRDQLIEKLVPALLREAKWEKRPSVPSVARPSPSPT